MRVAVVHYHLKPGGVTRVIENACAALKDEAVSLAVLSGEPYTGDHLANTACVPELAYCTNAKPAQADALVKNLQQAARQALGAEPDVWHIHNHSLGKNVVFADALHALANSGARILLQIHDFAEDGRPANYLRLREHISDPRGLYPFGDAIQYALLNARDRSILIESGLPQELCHLLPNPVTPPDTSKESRSIQNLDTDALVLYPTRGIRRKNLGELILWAATDKDNRTFATTATPANPEHLPVHERWKTFAQERKLPVRLGLCDREGFDFATLMQAASSMISTSVAEGFGLAFLEPWLLGKALCGRDLPDITRDFIDRGITLDTLYQRLEIPVNLIDTRALCARLSAALKATYTAYHMPLPGGASQRAYASLCSGGSIDFGALDEPMQESFIETVLGSPSLRESIRPASLSVADSASIAQNRSRILEHYSLERYGKQLWTLYQQIAGTQSGANSSLDPKKVLEAFLKPERLQLLRT